MRLHHGYITVTQRTARCAVLEGALEDAVEFELDGVLMQRLQLQRQRPRLVVLVPLPAEDVQIPSHAAVHTVCGYMQRLHAAVHTQWLHAAVHTQRFLTALHRGDTRRYTAVT